MRPNPTSPPNPWRRLPGPSQFKNSKRTEAGLSKWDVAKGPASSMVRCPLRLPPSKSPPTSPPQKGSSVAHPPQFEGATEFSNLTFRWKQPRGKPITNMVSSPTARSRPTPSHTRLPTASSKMQGTSTADLPKNVYGPDGNAIRKGAVVHGNIAREWHDNEECFPLAKFVFIIQAKRFESANRKFAATSKKFIDDKLGKTLGAKVDATINYNAVDQKVNKLNVESPRENDEADILDEVEKKLRSDGPQAAAIAACRQQKISRNISQTKTKSSSKQPVSTSWTPNLHFQLTFRDETELTGTLYNALKGAIVEKAKVDQGSVSMQLAQGRRGRCFLHGTFSDRQIRTLGNSMKSDAGPAMSVHRR